jgi:hypothetical protein
MHSLAQPTVLARAGLAAVLASLACYPRMAAASDARAPLLFTWLILLWCQFVLWAFVFAWQVEYSHHPVFGGRFRPKIWALATLCGVVWAFLFHFQDPQYRLLAPADYPTDLNSWVAMTLFALALQPLFTYFAPFAFFIRLSREASVAVPLTVLFGVFVLYEKLITLKTPPPVGLVLELAALRVLGGYLTLYFYLNGGVVLVWWTVLLVQLRHLPGLLQAH